MLGYRYVSVRHARDKISMWAGWLLLLVWGVVLRIALKSLNRLNQKCEAVPSLDNDDVTEHSTLALMRRILADAQAKLRVMVEENVGTGLRLDCGAADPDKSARGGGAGGGGECAAGPRGPPIPLNNNNSSSVNNNGGGGASSSPGPASHSSASSTSSSTSSGATSVSTPSSAPASGQNSISTSGPSDGSPPPCPPPRNDPVHLLHNDEAVAKRLSSGSSPGDKRNSLSDKSISPVDRKDGSSPVGNRRPSPTDLRNGSPGANPADKTVFQRRAPPPIMERTRLASSGGSVDSRTDSPSRNVFQRSSSERVRSGGNQRVDPLSRPIPPIPGVGLDLDKDVIVDGEDHEPPAPAPSSRPHSPGNALGIGNPVVASRLSNLHGGNHEVASTRRLRLENERLVAEVARLRRLLLSGASRGEVGADEASIEDEARYVALEMELQHTREALAGLKADRKRLRAEKFDLINQMKALYGTLEDKERELRDFIRNYEQRMRDSDTNLNRISQSGSVGGGSTDEREIERERERWSLLKAAREEADRSLTLAANLADKEAALAHAHATIKELKRQLSDRGGLSDQESLVSFPRGSVNGAATPGAGSASGVAGILGHLGSSSSGVQQSQPAVHHGSVGELGPGVVGSGAAPLNCNTGQAGDRGSCSADSGVRGSSDRESGGATSIGGNLSDSTTDGNPTITLEGYDLDDISVVSSAPTYQMYNQPTTPKDCSPTLSPLNAFSRSMDNSSLSRSVEQLSSPLDAEPKRNKISSAMPLVPQTVHSRSSATRGGTWGSISRVFARSRHRKATSTSGSGLMGVDGPEAYDPYRSWSPLTEEGYAEKLRLLREAASVPMERWRAPTVLAWLEVALGMPQYGPRCAENVKSGKVLLELSDAELEAGLGVTHPLHRKKLRLAIEEHRHPNLVRYPCISQLGHTWVSSEWLPDLGLSQYAESFATNMVDARMLDHLSKKELEKLLGVTRKFHQASIVHGINLLRMLNYDRQALAVRRHNSEQVDADPLVWTNQRFIKWARNIDLAEYADNLKDSGVHGALVVLEPSFTGDTMATALGIPPAKHMIRRHLTAELEAIVLPARGQLEVVPRNGGIARPMSTIVNVGSLGRGGRQHPMHHHPLVGGAGTSNTIDRRRCSLRGSLSRALGLRPRSEKASPSSSSDTGSLASQSQYMASLGSNSPPPPQLPPRPATISGNTKRHRRVKSIGDIDYMSSAVSTPV